MRSNALAAAFVSRLPFLSAREKIRLSIHLQDNFITGEKLLTHIAGLGFYGLEKIAGRRLARTSWEPRLWLDTAKRDLDFLCSVGGRLVSWNEHEYPAMLRETSRPPFALYVRGRLPAGYSPCLAIVGTRYPTGRGMECAFALAKTASESRVEVISGLARGIDSAAHKGSLAGYSLAGYSLANSGPGFAVLGCGIDRIHPPSNKVLAREIIEKGGGLLSEYPPGVNPSRWTFPERNRILAGLCRATLVIEAPGSSGALITASFALEEGRDVYVAGHCLGGPRSAGTDAMHADGAMPVYSFADILDDWNCACPGDHDKLLLKETAPGLYGKARSSLCAVPAVGKRTRTKKRLLPNSKLKRRAQKTAVSSALLCNDEEKGKHCLSGTRFSVVPLKE
ncbi:DNA-processing protein DprA [Spirochaetota bacterium]